MSSLHCCAACGSRLSPECHPISIQTNGTLLSAKLLDLFAETRTSVSVSIDGPPEANDLARLDHRGESTYSATMRGIRLLASHSESQFLFAGTLSVIQPSVGPALVYQFLKALGLPAWISFFRTGTMIGFRQERHISTARSTANGWSGCLICISRIRRRSDSRHR